MEYGKISSPLVCVENIADMFGSLPPECQMPKEEDIKLSLVSEFGELCSDQAIFDQLQRDCNLNNLLFEGECTTLEEVLNVTPPRPEGLIQLKTLENIKKVRSVLKKRVSLLHAIHRLPRPLVDLSYNNMSDDPSSVTELIPDVRLTVSIYRPIAFPTLDISALSRYLVMTQRLVLLGSQTLKDLRDAIKCPQDEVWLGDCSDALDDPQLHIPARRLYKSSFFFVEGTFFDKPSCEQGEYLSTPILEWMKLKEKDHKYGSLTVSPMDLMPLSKLTVHVGKPYLFLHQGNCEHVIIISDIMLPDRECCHVRSAFPILTGRCLMRSLKCIACRRLAARWMVTKARMLLPVDPCLLCDVCLRMLVYNSDGSKVYPETQVHMHCGEEIVS
ncbi:unnamed protein product [Calicophoron daubneyi]|uniref:snRNA-activating protein complex subunit 3 n=1 Tax=Calicophoron daubneyi TaxID=300641 RepID=A0AAV2T6W8_CALDB